MEVDAGRGDVTPLILRCVVATALFITAGWFLIDYVLDSLFR
jgi:hypothetical protein